jgi:hypothetical protein
VVLGGEEDNHGQSALGHLTARPHAAVVGEHLHPSSPSGWVVSGRFGTRIVGVERTPVAGQDGAAGHAWPTLGAEVAPGLGRWLPKRPKRAMAGCLVWSR